MAKTPDKELYLCMTGGRTCGKTSSQVAESANNTLIEMRGEEAAKGLLLFIEQEIRRVAKNKERAISYDSQQLLPPRVRKNFVALTQSRDNMQLSGKICSARLFPNGWAKVTSTKSASLSYMIGLAPLSCECKESFVTSNPCQQELEKQIAKKAGVETLFAEKDLTKTWKEQYADLPVALFSELSVFKFTLGIHKMPVAKKIGRGRPKLNKRKKGQIEISMSKNAKKGKVA